MHPGRILGVIMGLVILISVFLLPFFTGLTLYGIAGPMLGAIGQLQGLPVQTMTLGYLIIISFILLVIAGFVGIFPLGTGVLGVVGMAILTVAPFLVGTEASLLRSFVGIGYYVAWFASIVALAASFWHRRSTTASQVVEVNVQQPSPPAQAAPQPITIVQPAPTPVQQVPPPPTSPQMIIVSPKIDVKAESKTETVAPATSPGPRLEPGLKAGANYTPEEAMNTYKMLKQRLENQPIEKVEAAMEKFRFKDVSGRYWSVDHRTDKWVFYDGTKWVEASPPRMLESV